MTKCSYCKDKIELAPNGFYGMNDKFCQSCWSRINTVYEGLRILSNEPHIMDFVKRIQNREIDKHENQI